VLDEDTWNNDNAYRDNAMTAFHSFIAALGKCEGIEVDNLSRAMSGAEFTWQLSRQTDMWDYANLTDNG
jgi:hypothetical protein